MVQPLPRPKLGDRALDGDCIFTLRSASTNTSCHDASARAASICCLRSRGGQLCNQMCSNLKRRASRYTRFLCASRFVHLLRRVEPVFSVLRHTTFNEFLYIYTSIHYIILVIILLAAASVHRSVCKGVQLPAILRTRVPRRRATDDELKARIYYIYSKSHRIRSKHVGHVSRAATTNDACGHRKRLPLYMFRFFFAFHLLHLSPPIMVG